MTNDIESALSRWLSQKKAETSRQYAAHVRELRRTLENRSRSLETATRQDILAFVRSYPTYWARKRALIAIRSCYRFLSAEVSVRDLTASLTIAKVEADFEKVQRAVQLSLFAEGWKHQDVMRLTWPRLMTLIASGQLSNSPELRRLERRLIGRRRASRDSVVFPAGVADPIAS